MQLHYKIERSNNKILLFSRLHRTEHLDVRVTYDSVGSGNGKVLIKENKVHFAGSDVPLSEQEKEEYPDLNVLPTLAG